MNTEKPKEQPIVQLHLGFLYFGVKLAVATTTKLVYLLRMEF